VEQCEGTAGCALRTFLNQNFRFAFLAAIHYSVALLYLFQTQPRYFIDCARRP